MARRDLARERLQTIRSLQGWRAKQRRSINRTVKTKTRRKAFDKARTDKQVKALNKVRANARRKANATFGPGGTFPDPKKLKVRLDANKPLTKEDKERIAKAFETADKDSGRAIRKEYKTLLARVKITNLPQNQRAEHSRKLLKATKAVDRDEIKEKKTKQIKLIKPKKKRKDVDIMEWYKGWR